MPSIYELNQEIEALSRELGYAPEVVAGPSREHDGFWGRTARNIANIPYEGATALVNAGIGATGLLGGEAEQVTQMRQDKFRRWMEGEGGSGLTSKGALLRVERPDAPETFSEKASDLLLGSVAPQIAAAMAVPLGGPAKSLLGGIGKETARGAIMGAQTGTPEGALEQAAYFGATGGLAKLPGEGAKGLLRRSLAQASVPVAVAAVHPDKEVLSEETAVNALVQGGFGALTDRVPLRSLFRRKPEPRVVEPEVEVLPPEAQLRLQEGPNAPMGWRRQIEWPHGEARTISRSGEPIINPGRRVFLRTQDDLTTAPVAEGDVFSGVKQQMRLESPGAANARRADEALARLRFDEPMPAPTGLRISAAPAKTAEAPSVASEPTAADPLSPAAPPAATTKTPAKRQLVKRQTPVEPAGESSELVALRKALAEKQSELHATKSLARTDPDAAADVPGLERELETIQGAIARRTTESGQIGSESVVGSEQAKLGNLMSLLRREEGSVNPSALSSAGGGVAGAAYGYATGDTEEERLLRAAGFGLAGASLGAMAPRAVAATRQLLRRKSAPPHTVEPPPSGPESRMAAGRGAEAAPAKTATPEEQIKSLLSRRLKTTDEAERARLWQEADKISKANPEPPSTNRGPGGSNVSMVIPWREGIAGTIGYNLPADNDDERIRNAALLAGGTAAGRALLKRVPEIRKGIIRRSADYVNKSEGQTIPNRIAHEITRWTRTGEEAPALTAFQRGSGFRNTLSDELEAAKRKVSPQQYESVSADPKAKAALQRWSTSAGTASDEAALKAALPAEYAAAMIAARRASLSVKSEGAKAEGAGTKRGAMLAGTQDYKTQSYDIFLDPKSWKKDAAAFDTVVSEAVAKTGLPRQQAVDDLERYLAELKRGDDYASAGSRSKISQYLYAQRENLSPAMKKLLGEVKDPTKRELLTAQKLIGSAQQFKTINELDAAVRPDGRKLALTQAEKNAAKFDTSDYVKLEGVGYGKLDGKFLPVDVVQRLQNQSAIEEKFFNEALGGWLRKGTSLPKAVVTVGNIATHARQWVQTPLFVIASRGNPLLLREAWGAMRDKAHPLWRELRENGIIGANFSHNEFMKAAAKLGTKDGFLKKTWDVAKTVYGMPDDIVRALAYVTAKRRHGGDVAKAVEHVNKFTMNYGAQSRAVNLSRNVPIVNPFVSFVSEMMRVSKNLADEAVNGKTIADKAWAMAALGGMWGAGKAVSEWTKSDMTPAERKEWDQIVKLMPSWQRHQEHAVLDKNIAGGRDFIGLNALTPGGDLLGFAKALAKGDWEAIAKENPYIGLHKNPLLSAVIDVLDMEHHFTGEPIKGAGEIASRISEAVLPPDIGIETPSGASAGGFEGKKTSRLIHSGGEWSDPKSGRHDSAKKALLRKAGFTIQSTKLQPLRKRADWAKEEELRRLKSQAESKLRTAKTPKQREAIQRRLLQRRKDVLEEWQEKAR